MENDAAGTAAWATSVNATARIAAWTARSVRVGMPPDLLIRALDRARQHSRNESSSARAAFD